LTNIRIFPQECEWMPNFALHEPAHGYRTAETCWLIGTGLGRGVLPLADGRQGEIARGK
jgi:hypothetical protein